MMRYYVELETAYSGSTRLDKLNAMDLEVGRG